ncbi:MAG: DnaA/Hda family protein, partial [Cognatishimia sp.]|nr:DnaA/Hda family protein [Cognatishimia sp.]
MTQDQLGAFQREMLETVGQNNYKAWIEPLEFEDIKDGVATFNVPTNFIGNYVSQNFGDLLIHKLTTLGESVQRVHFRVANTAAAPRVTSPSIETPASAVETPRPAAQQRMDTAKADLPGAPLDARFTFDSFVVGKPNELANAAARRVAEGGPVSFNPLFLYGGVGLGKTHLMHAIAWELQNRRPDLNVLYLSA